MKVEVEIVSNGVETAVIFTLDTSTYCFATFTWTNYSIVKKILLPLTPFFLLLNGCYHMSPLCLTQQKDPTGQFIKITRIEFYCSLEFVV